MQNISVVSGIIQLNQDFVAYTVRVKNHSYGRIEDTVDIPNNKKDFF